MSSAKDDDVSELTNKELKERLTNLGIQTGPIVASTRKLYEKKLEKLLHKGKELAYSTDEDVAPETPVIEPEPEEKPKRPVRTKKATKKVEEQKAQDKYSDDEDEQVTEVRKSRRIKNKKEAEKETEEKQPEEEQANQEEEEAQPEEELEDSGTLETPETPETEAVEIASNNSNTADSKTRVNTLLFFILLSFAIYLVYSEAGVLLEKSDLWKKYVVETYTKFYYSLMPEIETTTHDAPPPPPVADEL